MTNRKRWMSVTAVSAVGMAAFLLLRGSGSPAPREIAGASADPAAPETVAVAPSPGVTPRVPSPASAGAAADKPGQTDKIRVSVADRDEFESAANIIEYFKQKPLPKHGPVHSVGDGIDSSDRNAKLPPDTSFARFRYEYEKHDTDRLMSDLTWADGELARIDYEGRKAKQTLSDDDRIAGELLTRRRQAIVSILAQRAREEELHDRYQRVEVIYQDPNEAKSNGGG